MSHHSLVRPALVAVVLAGGFGGIAVAQDGPANPPTEPGVSQITPTPGEQASQAEARPTEAVPPGPSSTPAPTPVPSPSPAPAPSPSPTPTSPPR